MTKDIALRRHAFEIVSQLPENPREARIVLEYVKKLFDEWFQDQPCGRTPSLRAISNDSDPVSFSSSQPTVRPGICRASD